MLIRCESIVFIKFIYIFLKVMPGICKLVLVFLILKSICAYRTLLAFNYSIKYCMYITGFSSWTIMIISNPFLTFLYGHWFFLHHSFVPLYVNLWVGDGTDTLLHESSNTVFRCMKTHPVIDWVNSFNMEVVTAVVLIRCHDFKVGTKPAATILSVWCEMSE